jgi:hypothetical protein
MAISEAPGRFRWAQQARNTLKVPSRSMSTTVLKPLADMPRAGAKKLPAAPDTTMSNGPCAAATAASAPSTAA